MSPSLNTVGFFASRVPVPVRTNWSVTVGGLRVAHHSAGEPTTSAGRGGVLPRPATTGEAHLTAGATANSPNRNQQRADGRVDAGGTPR
ncbi:hypothetical protein [Streptomyces sp. NPDC005548]|uniref:hypothetical protein n=1 Tax=unclassified Streptomyces TaxID=2593676 RepID=UPI0036A6B4E9